MIATGQNEPTGIALSGTEVYWASRTDGTVVKCPKSGCGSAGPSVVVSGQPGLQAIALHGSMLYWTTLDDAGTASSVMKCDVAACGSGTPAEPNPGPRGLFGPYGIAANADRLFVGAWMQLLSCPIGGCGADTATIHASGAGIMNVALNATDIYFVRWGGASISRCAIDGCSGTETTLVAGARSPLAFAIDDENLYWSVYDYRGTNELGGAIRSCPLAGCEVTASRLLAAGRIGAAGIAVDPTDLYYTDHMNGQVVRLAKNSTTDLCDPGLLLGCGSCGGLTRCDGMCSIATPPDLGCRAASVTARFNVTEIAASCVPPP